MRPHSRISRQRLRRLVGRLTSHIPQATYDSWWTGFSQNIFLRYWSASSSISVHIRSWAPPTVIDELYPVLIYWAHPSVSAQQTERDNKRALNDSHRICVLIKEKANIASDLSSCHDLGWRAKHNESLRFMVLMVRYSESQIHNSNSGISKNSAKGQTWYLTLTFRFFSPNLYVIMMLYHIMSRKTVKTWKLSPQLPSGRTYFTESGDHGGKMQIAIIYDNRRPRHEGECTTAPAQETMATSFTYLSMVGKNTTAMESSYISRKRSI